MAPWPSFSPSVEAHVDTAKSHGHTDLLSAAVDSDSACVRVGSACRHAGGLVLVQDSERMGREVFSLQVAVTARPGCVEPSRLSATPPPRACFVLLLLLRLLSKRAQYTFTKTE